MGNKNSCYAAVLIHEDCKVGVVLIGAAALAPPVRKGFSRVWSSFDGISWKKSLETTPSDMETPELVTFDNALWSIFPNEPSGECWKSFNDGDSWVQVSTNVPDYTFMGTFKYENKLLIYGNRDFNSTVMWSADGIEWSFMNGTLYFSDEPNLSIMSLPNGRLYLSSGNYDINFIGGPKKQGELYYYRKD